MTPEQKLAYLYKKLVNDKVSTKSTSEFFEEPISTYSQVSLSYVYVNSSYIPTIAPREDVIFNGASLMTYVVDEALISIDSEGRKYKTRNGRLIPLSYGEGYGISLKTRDGQEIDQTDFPVLIDWESGEIEFETSPFDVDRNSTPLATYYWYSGKTLRDIKTFTIEGQRGERGPQGNTGPIDISTLIYRGETSFTASPPLVYNVNDVITFTTNGDSYICVIETSDSPLVSPSSWKLLSPSGTASQIPENVVFIYDQDSTPLSNLSDGTPGYSTSLQGSVDSINSTPTLFIINHKSNLLSLCDTLNIEGKEIDFLFEKGALICTNPLSPDFSLTIKDSDVIFKNVTIGRDVVTPESRIMIESLSRDTNVKFVNCNINSQLLTIKRSSLYNCSVTFENCSMNMGTVDCNGDLGITGSKFSGTWLFDYEIQEVAHRLTINNSFYYSGLVPDGVLKDTDSITIRCYREDSTKSSIKFENSFLPQIGVSLYPKVNTYSPIDFTIDANNTVFYTIGLDKDSAYNAGSLRIVGTNNSCAGFFPVDLRSFAYPGMTLEESFYSILPNDSIVSIFDPTRSISYDTYKYLQIQRAKYSILSL